MKVAIFDFDGTLRVPITGEWISPGNMKLGPAFAFFYQAHRGDYLIFGLTNQGGVAYGHKTMEQVHEENEEMCSLLRNKIYGSESKDIDLFEKIIIAPHYPGVDCDVSFLRKPEIGALGVIEHHLNEQGITPQWNGSFMCGDRKEDKAFAKKASIDFFDAKNWK